jgi:hypothetical protein
VHACSRPIKSLSQSKQLIVLMIVLFRNMYMYRSQGLGASEKKKIQKNTIYYYKGANSLACGQPIVCTTLDFHAVLFWFVYDTSAVRRSILTIGVSLERKITWPIQIMLKFLTLRQFIFPLSLFLKEIPFSILHKTFFVNFW